MNVTTTTNEQRIPTIEEVVELVVHGQGMILLMELKLGIDASIAAPLLDGLFANNPVLYEKAAVLSFFPNHLYAVRTVNPSIPTVMLFSEGMAQAFCASAVDHRSFERSIFLCACPVCVDWLVAQLVRFMPYYLGLGGLSPHHSIIDRVRIEEWSRQANTHGDHSHSTSNWIYVWGQDLDDLDEDSLRQRLQLYADTKTSYVPSRLPLPPHTHTPDQSARGT